MVGYLGPKGTFSYQAVHKYFGGDDNIQLREFTSIHSLIKAADSGEITSALVPIENSLEGSVNTTLDTLAFETELFICGEYTMAITENLMVLPGTCESDIKKIISHPQPIGQCAEMINMRFPDAVIEYTNSTAAAAELVQSKKDKSIAVIGSAICAGLYSLDILIPGCNDRKNNSTRFVDLRKYENTDLKEADKSSFVFAVENKPGALYKAIGAISENNVNMLKIESRPEKNVLGRYIFFIDTDGCISDANLKKAWEEIKRIAYKCKFLGSYKKG